MLRRRRLTIVLLVALSVLGGAAHALPLRAQETSVEDRLMAFAGKLRLGLSIASFAVYAPTIGDLHLHAQQLVNLLEGSEGPHYRRTSDSQEVERGLRSDVGDFLKWFSEVALEPEIRVRIAAATRNMAAYLEYALNAALASLKRRRLDQATEEMLKAYAYLAAAHERPTQIPYVPGLWTILRLIGISDPAVEV